MNQQMIDRAVTVAGGDRTADLVVPSAVPVADLLPALARAVGVPPGQLGWELVPVGSSAVSAESTLAGAGVADGAVLLVRPAGVHRDPPAVRSVRDRLPDDGPPIGGQRSDSAGLVMTTLLVLPAVLAVGWVLTDPTVVTSPSLALLISAVVLALLAGWTAARASERTSEGTARGWPSVAAAAGLGWSATAGCALVGAVAPTAPGVVLGAGGAAATAVASLVGGLWTIARTRANADELSTGSSAGWAPLAAGVAGVGALLLTMVGAMVVGTEVALRGVAVLAVVSIGWLPAVVVAATGLLRVDGRAGVDGVPADVAGRSAERAAAVLVGALTGVVGVAVAALAARLPDSGPSDVLTAGALAVVLATRGRTLGARRAAIPMAGSAAMTVTALALASAHSPADRLAVAVVGVAVGFGAFRVIADRVGPLSPAMGATRRRLTGAAERVLVCLVIPVASGALQWSVVPWLGQWWPGAS